MKKLLIVNVLAMLSFAVFAQKPAAKTPPKSPEAAFTQQFGDSEIQVQYARPLTRGRKIFGALVPFDSLWRTGAGECTTIKTKEEVIIGGKKLAAGKYALFTIPRADEWTVVLNSDVSLHGVFGYSEQKDVHRFTVKPVQTPRFYEAFTMEIGDFTVKGDASLNIMWENTMVQIPLQSPLFATTETAAAPKPDAHAGHDMSKMDKPTQNTEGGKTAETTAKTDAHAGHNMSKMNKPTQNTEGGKMADLKAEFASVFSNYYELKDALIADNGKAAADKAKAMKTALAKLDTKTWSVKDRTAYDAVAKKLETDAEHIGDNAGKIDHQREHFVTLSANLSSLVKSLKMNVETTYLQFCPMANEGKGAYWLSKEEKVKNPYYGKKMLTCGSVKETLK